MLRSTWVLISLLLALTACSTEGTGNDAAGDGGVAEGAIAEAEGLTTLIIAPQSATLTPGVPKQFTALGEYATGETKDLTAVAVWSTDDPTLVEIDDADHKGLATVHADGRITITARVGAVEATLTIGHACAYPADYAAQIVPGEVVPPFGYAVAFGPNTEQVAFSMEDFACDDRYETVHFLLGTGWCGACSALAQRTGAEGQAIEDAGGLMVYVELEDGDSNPVDSHGATAHYDRLIGSAPGLRVGDLSSSPSAQFLGNAARGIINGYPTTFSVRRRDMRVIAVDQPFLAVSQDPDRDWTQPFVPEFNNNCGEGDDEPSEPNNTPDEAGALEPGQHGGGICTPEGDFYQVAIEGRWQLALDFDGGLADLDVYAWDVAQDGPLQIDGRPVGSDGTTGHEAFEHTGPALIQVLGFRGASAPYQITLEAL